MDGIHAAGDGRHRNHLVTHRCQLGANAIRNRLFDLDRIAFGPDPRRLDCLLQTHAVINQIDQRLQRALRISRAVL